MFVVSRTEPQLEFFKGLQTDRIQSCQWTLYTRFSGHDVQCNEVKFQSLLKFWGSNFKEGWINHKKVIQFLVNQIFATLEVGQNRSMCTDNAQFVL